MSHPYASEPTMLPAGTPPQMNSAQGMVPRPYPSHPSVPSNGTPAVVASVPVGLDFRFDGGAASYLGVGVLSVLLTVVTLGIALPWAVAMRYRWVSQHTLINGQRVQFTGTGGSLWGHWIKWWLLCVVTFGVYSFWVQPRLTRWVVEHQRAVVPITFQAPMPMR